MQVLELGAYAAVTFQLCLAAVFCAPQERKHEISTTFKVAYLKHILNFGVSLLANLIFVVLCDSPCRTNQKKHCFRGGKLSSRSNRNHVEIVMASVLLSSCFYVISTPLLGAACNEGILWRVLSLGLGVVLTWWLGGQRSRGASEHSQHIRLVDWRLSLPTVSLVFFVIDRRLGGSVGWEEPAILGALCVLQVSVGQVIKRFLNSKDSVVALGRIEVDIIPLSLGEFLMISTFLFVSCFDAVGKVLATLLTGKLTDEQRGGAVVSTVMEMGLVGCLMMCTVLFCMCQGKRTFWKFCMAGTGILALPLGLISLIVSGFCGSGGVGAEFCHEKVYFEGFEIFGESTKAGLLWAKWILFFLSQSGHTNESEGSDTTVSLTWNTITKCRHKYVISWIISIAVWGWAVTSFLMEGASDNRHTVIKRKYFHVFACLIFLPCTINDPEMMALSHMIACCFLITLETFRLTLFRKSKLDNFIAYFLDSKENPDNFVFSHLYLISGCATGVWLDMGGNINTAVVGILAVGVGDCFAAVTGIKYGKHRWPGETKRTLEGSLGCWVSMILVGSFIGCDILNFRFIWMVTVVSVLEACTENVDNLILPIVGGTIMML